MKHVYLYKYDVLFYVGTHLHHTIIETVNPYNVALYMDTMYEIPEGNIVSVTLLSKKLAY